MVFVFNIIKSSNILIGLLNYLKRNHIHTHHHHSHSLSSTQTTATQIQMQTSPTPPPRKPKHMSHAALALILERGRPITRRCVVASSPLYQSMESAEQLGYEVRVYARVPDLGGGDDRRKSGDMSGAVGAVGGNVNGGGGGKGHKRKNSSGGGGSGSFRKGGHARRVSGGNMSGTTESSEQGAVAGGGFPQAFVRSLGAQTSIHASGGESQGTSTTTNGSAATTAHGSATTNGTTLPAHSTPPAAPTPPSARIRYREQGVDELLQLKLHQALAATDVPPPNATIVLATGDGNVGQFNDDGFLGPVRTALKKGWRVELYAWEEGLSRAWEREFGEGPWKERFRIIGMETFGADLMEV